MTSIVQLDTADLAGAVRGPVLTPDMPGYDEEVAGFNLAHRPRPAVVVGATCAADVAAAVRWATGAGLRVCAQATGHGLTSDLADTLMVSTRRMTALHIDPVARTARVGAGTRWRQVIDAAAPFGLAPLNGSSSAVGVVGYTLGGGIGPIARKYGFAADHVRSFSVVTGDGELRLVDADRHPDLFWAVLGGKIGFGVVTEIEFDLVPVTRFYGGGIFFPGAAAADILQAWRTWAPTLPAEATTSVALLRLPPDPALPPQLQGQFVTHLRFAHLGDAAEAEQLLAPMRSAATALMDLVAENPYLAVDTIHLDPTSPMPAYDRGMTLSDLPAAAVETLINTAGADSGSVLALVEIRLLGGALAAEPAVPNAVTGRDAAFSVYVLGVPAGPAADLVPAQVAGVIDSLATWRRGSLINFLGHAGPGEIGTLWADADRSRLGRIAHRYDPADIYGGAVVFAAADAGTAVADTTQSW